jgi:hypothetical protein
MIRRLQREDFHVSDERVIEVDLSPPCVQVLAVLRVGSRNCGSGLFRIRVVGSFENMCRITSQRSITPARHELLGSTSQSARPRASSAP